MPDNINDTKLYVYLSPEVKVIYMNVRQTLCQTSPINEKDCGDGGFE